MGFRGKIRFFNFLILIIISTALMSCGAASPPAILPGPVSQLTSVGNPSEPGASPGALSFMVSEQGVSQVLVTGAPGALLPNAGFVITTPAGNFTGMGGEDGSFRKFVTGLSIGDIFNISQTLGEQTSPPTELEVTGRVINVGPPIMGTWVTGTGIVWGVGPEGTEGQTFRLPFLSSEELFSFPSPNTVFPGTPGITGVVIDPTNKQGVIYSPGEGVVQKFNLGTREILPAETNVAGTPLIMDILNSGLGILGLRNETNPEAFQMYQGQSLLCSAAISHPQNPGLTHVATPIVKIGEANGMTHLLAISQFSDQSYVLTRAEFSSCDELQPFTNFQQTLLDFEPRDARFFNQGWRVMMAGVTNLSGSELGTVKIYDFDTQQLSTIGISAVPFGVDVDEINSLAYVSLPSSNQLLSINLLNFNQAPEPLEDICLTPNHVLLLPNKTQTVLFCAGDNSFTLVDL